MRRIDVVNMNKNELEVFFTELLQKAGFIVSEEPVDKVQDLGLIAYSKEPFYKGKYLIQYIYKTDIDLTNVEILKAEVLRENATKGILIANSSFSQGAQELANTKNIELIDANLLNELIEKYFHLENKPLTRESTLRVNYFTKYAEFDVNKYDYLMQIVEKEKKSYDAYLELFNFLYSYVINKNYKIMYAGLIYECISLTEDILKKFANKTKSGRTIYLMFSTMLGILYMLLGQISMSCEILHKLHYSTFNLNNFTYNLVNNHFYFKPEHYFIGGGGINEKESYSENVSDVTCVLYKANLLTLLMHFDDVNNGDCFYQRFTDYINGVKNKADNENEFKVRLKNIANKNYKIVVAQIEKVMNKEDQRLYLPAQLGFKYEYSGLYFSIDRFINIEDIKPYWTDIDYGEQRKQIELILSLDK